MLYWQFHEHFSQQMEKSNANRKHDADNYHYFTWDDKGGVTGIAGVGTVCSSTRARRTAITEWVQNQDDHYSETQCLLVNNVFQHFYLIVLLQFSTKNVVL